MRVELERSEPLKSARSKTESRRLAYRMSAFEKSAAVKVELELTIKRPNALLKSAFFA